MMSIDHICIATPAGRTEVIYRLFDDGKIVGCYGSYFDAEDAMIEAEANKMFDSITFNEEKSHA